MKNMRILAVLFLCLTSTASIAQELKIVELKNPTIKAFLTALDGTELAAEKALAKYCLKEVIEAGMIPMGKITRVISEEENCVRFETLWVIDEDDSEEEAEPMVYDVCEEGGKIIFFDLDFGDGEYDEEGEE
ncbi:MAG: hypothetical protein QNL61_06310 [Crocinitomicaceae bacterium]